MVSKYLTRRMYEFGLTCRVAARGATPVMQLSPPLIAGPEQFEEIAAAVRVALVDAMGEFGLWPDRSLHSVSRGATGEGCDR